MTALEELEMTARQLSERLEKASNEDKRFCADIQLILERMSWDFYRAANDLQQIRDYV